jgi:hypothetical protein
MAHEDMAEMLRDREWERRKKRALQSMRKEYEDERRRELEEVTVGHILCARISQSHSACAGIPFPI